MRLLTNTPIQYLAKLNTIVIPIVIKAGYKQVILTKDTFVSSKVYR